MVLYFFCSTSYVWSGIPIPDKAYETYIVGNNIYRYSIEISINSFIDAEDGNTKNLQLQWLFTNNLPVPDTYWIFMKRSQNKDELIFYVSRSVWENKYYYFNLKAIDKDGNYATKLYNFTFVFPPQEPTYKRMLVLESKSSDVFQTSNVGILFYIQEQKLYTYSQLYQQGILSVSSLITDDLKVTKQNGLTTVTLIWSSDIFLLNWCNLIRIINFRSKTLKEFNTTYKQYFSPEFDLKQSTESFYGACSYLSIDPPIISNSELNSFQTDFGVYFTFIIPSGLFFAPTTGKSMDILLELRTSSGEKLPSSYWIALNGNNISSKVTLEGFVSYNQAVQQSNYNFQLVAITPLLEESNRVLKININSFQSIQKNFVILLNGTMTILISYLNFITKFLSVLSGYLSFSSSIIIFDVETLSGQINVKWSLYDFTLKDCDFTKLSLLKSKLVDENGFPVDGFKNALNGSIGYSIKSVTLTTELACVIDRKGPVRDELYRNITIKDTIYRFSLPLEKTTFVDEKDGDMSKLTLEFLLPNEDNVPINNWVQLLRSKDKDQLIGFLSLETFSKINWNFILRATDSDGNYATKAYNFVIDAQPLIPYYQFSLTLQTSSAEIISKNDVELVFYIQEQKILPYSLLQNQGITNVNTLILLELNVKREFSLITIRLLWSSSIFAYSSCDENKILRYRLRTFDAFVNVYSSFFLPQFTLLNNIEKFVGVCNYLSSDPPVAGNPAFIKIDVAFGLLFSVNIPSDVFSPPVSGSVMKLSIYLKGKDGEDLPFFYWISLSENTLSNNLRFVGYASNDVALIQTVYRFSLVATTPLLVNASRFIVVNIVNNYQVKENFVVTLASTSYNISAYTTFLNNFLSAIANYLLYPLSSILVLGTKPSLNGIVIRWTLKEFAASECNIQELNVIYNKLVNKNGQATGEFLSTLNSIIFTLSSINIAKLNACDIDKSPPVPDEPLFNISIFNTIYRFTLPLKQSTFVDSKDGDMRNLKVELLLENGEPVLLSNWVQLSRNNGKDELIGYIAQSAYNKLIWKFILKATDSDGNYATKFCIFYFQSPPKQPSYKMLLTLRSNLEDFINKNDVLVLFYIQEMKILNYSLINLLGVYNVNSLITVNLKISRNVGEISISLLWSATDFVSSYCQLDKIVQLRQKTSGQFAKFYSSMFLPEFNMTGNEETFFDACSYLSADPPIFGSQQFKEINVQSGTLFSVSIPSDIFRPPVSGNTMLLNLELRNQNGEYVSLNWITLNGKIFQNGVRVEGYVPYDMALKKSSFIFQLVAITPLLEELVSIFNVTILENKILQLNFVVTFSSQSYCVGNYIFISNFVSKVSNYLLLPISSIVIIKFESTTYSTNIQWTLLSLTDSSCDEVLVQTVNSKLKYANGTLNAGLLSTLNSMNFVITSITINLGLACTVDSKPPVPDSMSQDIIIQSNTYRFRIVLPNTTFVDAKDGNMNELKIDFLTENNSSVPIDNWVQLQKSYYNYEYIGYVNILISSSSIWTYFIKATDLAGNTASKKYNFIMLGKRLQTNYRKVLTLRSFSAVVYKKSDVGILFYIQEQKIYPYFLQQNLGAIDINTLITEQIEVTRSDTLVAIHLVWSSAIFISSRCDIQSLVNFRSKTLGSFEQLYSNFFLPEITLIGETEEFLYACNFLTNNPPVIGPSTLTNIAVKFGEFFTISLPNDLFTSTSSGTSLSVYLRDENGNALPDLYWITLSSTNLAVGLRIEGYASNAIAVQKTSFTFRLVAATTLQVEAYRLLTINIQGYKAIQQNFVVTFSTLSVINSFTAFSNQFVLAISNYLSYSASSILIISYETSSSVTRVQWTMVQFTSANCDSSSASSIALKLTNANGQINPNLVSVLTNINIVLKSVDVLSSDSCAVDRNGPVPDQLSQEYLFNSNVYRFSLTIPVSTFVDAKDGDMSKLTVELTTESGVSVSVDSWIELVQSGGGFRLNGYISSLSYTKAQWIFLLKATDSDNNVGVKKYIFNIKLPPQAPNYKRSLTLRSFSSAILNMRDVSILFFIEEKKLIPYSIGQNQGILEVESLIADSLEVIRSTGYITVKLVWSSTLFASAQCSLQRIINLRSKTIGAYSSIYSQMFQPEFMFMDDKESFLGACSTLSVDPPLVGPATLNAIGVRFGEFFSVSLPNELFTSTSSGTSLSVYLRDENGNALPDLYWITLSSTNLAVGLRIEGYASNAIAVQKTSFTFRLVAATTLQVEAYRLLTINIQGYKAIQQNFVVTFSTLSVINSFTAFSNQFVLAISNYLSYSASSILIISYETSSSVTRVQWTMVQFTSANCDSSSASSIALKLTNANGQINPNLVSVLTNINIVLKSVDVLSSDSCAVDRNGPVPDQLSQEYLFNSNVYRFSLTIPVSTFVDAKDGDMSKLTVELTTESGVSVSVDSWIELVQSGGGFRLNGYISSLSYTKAQWIFLLKATDSDNNVGVKKYIFNIKLPPQAPNYKRSLTLRSFSSAILNMRDVSILFFIEEKKLIPYSIGQNQGILEVESLIADSLEVIRSTGYITVKLVWSSTLFASAQCSLQRIINLRSKTIGAYSSIYSQMFQPEFMFMDDKESFLGACSTLSVDPPLVGPATLNAIGVRFGEFFSVSLPNELFTSTSSGTSLSVYLRDENGNALPDLYWITLSSTNLAVGLRIEGYASNAIAVQKTSFTFRLVAATTLQVEAYRLLTINIQGYKAIQQNFVVTFSTLSVINSFTAFSNQFVLAISNFLSYTASSVLILTFDVFNQVTVFTWTLMDFTYLPCNILKLLNVRSMLLNVGGSSIPNPALLISLSKINFVLSSLDIKLSFSCESDLNGPIPDEPYRDIIILNNVYRFNFTLPPSTFIDSKDGYMKNLNLRFTLPNGLSVSKENWVQLRRTNEYDEFIGFVTKQVYITNIWTFLLVATDNDGNSATKLFNFKVAVPPQEPFYKRTVVLRSYLSSIFAGNDVENLFFIQSLKLYPYALAHDSSFTSISNLITDFLVITRETTGTTRIQIIWSTTSFVSNNNECNVAKIVKFRSVGPFNDGYQSIFSPQFDIITMDETFHSACSFLSLDPPVVSKILQSYVINYGKFFTLSVPGTLFVPPVSGKTMQLTIQLRSLNGDPFFLPYWLKLSTTTLEKGFLLEGFATYLLLKEYAGVKFRIVAQTPLLVESYQLIEIKVQDLQPIQEHFIVTFVSKSFIASSYLVFLKQFISAISAYLMIQNSSLIIYSYEVQSSQTSVRFTLEEFAISPSCNLERISYFTSQFIGNNGLINSNLKVYLTNMNFAVEQVFIDKGSLCNNNKPVIKKPLGDLYFFWGTFFKYEIPESSYIDPIYGNNLKYYIIVGSNGYLSSDWLYVESSTILGVPIKDQIIVGVTYKFVLRVTNADGKYVDDTFSITSKYNPPLWSYLFQVRFNYDVSYQSLSRVMYGFLNRFIDYFGDTNRNYLIVSQVFTIPATRTILLFYYNTSFRLSPCDTKAQLEANLKLYSGNNVNPLLISAMSPEFFIIQINSNKDGSCYINAPPFVNIDVLSSNVTGPFYIKQGYIFKNKLPRNLFQDEEDGDISSGLLKTSMKSKDSDFDLPINSWIYYDKVTAIVYAVPIDISFEELGNKYSLTYILSAEDTGGLKVSTEYYVVPTGIINNYFQVSFTMNIFEIANKPYTYQLMQILPNLWNFFGISFENKICIRRYILSTINGDNAVATLTWTHCDLPISSCNYVLTNEIKRFIYNDGFQTLRSSLQTRFQYFQIVGADIISKSPCGFNAPTVTFQIPNLFVTFCGVFEYLIPENAFYDNEDGNTRSLDLMLTDSLGSQLTAESFLQFDSKRQRVTMLLTQTAAFSSRVFKFILTATDKSLLSKSQIVFVNIKGDAIPTDYKVTLQASLTFINPNINLMLLLAEKVGAYFGDKGAGFEAISYSQIADGSVRFEFGNCSINYQPCDALEQNKYKNFLKNADNSWSVSFKSILIPEFADVYLTDLMSGPCTKDGPPKILKRWGPLYVDIFSTFYQTVPENTFFDTEQGNTRKLMLEITDKSQIPLTTDFWVQFDKLTQTITVLANKNVAKLLPSLTLTLRLVAYDISGNSVMQNLDVVVNYPNEEPSFLINMQLTIVNTELQFLSYIAVYNKLRSSIESFFNNEPGSGTVSYIAASNTFQTALEISWTNRTISSVKCENDKLITLQSKLIVSDSVSPQFLNWLSPFRILDIKFQYNGICNDVEQPPIVLNPIMTLKVSFCGYLDYLIPQNTFFDKIDGATRFLKLEMIKSDGSEISLNSFVSFDPVKQRILISPFDLVAQDYPVRFSYNLKATNKRGKYVSTFVNIDIESRPALFSFFFQLSALWKAPYPASLSEIVKEFQIKTSSYLGYNNGSDVHIIDIHRITVISAMFTIKATSCRLRYDPCDELNVNNISTKLFDQKNYIIKQDYQTALQPNIEVLTLNVEKTGPCKPTNKPPLQYLPIPDLIVNAFSSVAIKLNPQTFRDDENGFNLNYIVVYINGIAVNTDSTWIYVTENQILSVIDNDVISQQPSNGYIVTVRAFDTELLYVDAPWRIKVIGNTCQTYYKFVLDLFSILPVQQKYIEKYYIAYYLNSFFNGNYTNFILYENPANNKIRFTWSSSSLINQCNNNAANIFFMNMKIGGSLVEKFRQAFQARYILQDVNMISDENCLIPLSPPIASLSLWTIYLKQCGGIQQQVPENTFFDPEDGNTRKLNLKLVTSDSLLLPKWIYFDGLIQTFYIYPTLEDAISYNQLSLKLKLIATDRTGLSATVTVSLVITLPPEAKYFFKFRFTINTFMSQALESLLFSQTLSKYLGDSSLEYISVKSYSILSNLTRDYTFSNCSIIYNPCDKALLNSLKKKFITSENFVISEFQFFMLPSFSIEYGVAILEYPCNTNTPSPPFIVVKIPTLEIPLCGYYEFIIPETAFYDAEDGSTRQLSLMLTKSDGSPLTSDSWIMFNEDTQTISAIPISKMFLSQSETTYILTATDSTQLPSAMSINIKVVGLLSVSTECMIRIDFSTTEFFVKKVDRLRFLIISLKNYFQLQSEKDLVIVDYMEENSANFRLYWSYCSSLNFQSSSEGFFDYYSLITNIFMKLYNEDRKTINLSFYSAFGIKYTVRNVFKEFTNRCKDLNPIVPPNIMPIAFVLPSCGYIEKDIQNNLFYDFEQGGTSNLKVTLLNNDLKEVGVDSWINFDNVSQSIIAVCNDKIRALLPQTFKFILKATDISGQFAQINVNIEKVYQPEYQKTPFELTMELRYNGLVPRVYAYEISYISQRLKNYYMYTDTILIKQYENQNGYLQFRRLTWTTCKYSGCNSSILSRTIDLRTSVGDLSQKFKNAFMSDFVVERVYYTSSACNPPLQPPYSPLPSPTFLNLGFCALFTYKFENSLFYDNVNGDMRWLEVKLTDDAGVDIAKSQFIQFNSATLEVNAVNIKTQSSTVLKKYRVIATNSAQLSYSVDLPIKFINTPFVSDCIITMKFLDIYGSLLSNFNVLWRIVEAITWFYNDSNIQIKVIDFNKNNDNTFIIKWSNCSFSFPTYEQSLVGLTDSNRSTLKMIYSKIWDFDSNSIKQSFQNALKNNFTVLSLDISYSCIEANPYPKEQADILLYPKSCELFMKDFPIDLFLDERDGNLANMELTLAYADGQPVSKYEWLQIGVKSNNQKYIYGMVTSGVKKKVPPAGYHYLLVCTDKSGRTASLKLIAYVDNIEQLFNNKFVIGFTTSFTKNVSTAFIQAAFMQKAAIFFDRADTKTNIYVEEFSRNLFTSFSHCSLPCNEISMRNLYSKLQVERYSTIPSFQLVYFFRPLFEINYVYASAPKCVEPVNVTIITGFCGNFLMPACGWFTYVLPSTCFHDNYARSINDFSVKIYQNYMIEIESSSWIQFDPSSKTLYGIPIWSKISSANKFNVIASHPISGNSAINSLTINTEDFSFYSSTNQMVCVVSMSIQINENSENEIMILKDFISRIAQFINDDFNKIQVLSFTKSDINIFQISYSNCSWNKLLQNNLTPYLQVVFSVIEHYFETSAGTIVDLKSSFKDYLKPQFEVLQFAVSKECTSIPLSIPVANRELVIVLQNSCGEFSYTVPSDLFTDSVYGNTRNLDLIILQENEQELQSSRWINIGTDQRIYGLIDKTITDNQPLGGYRFKLKAFNKERKAGITIVTIRIENTIWTHELIKISGYTQVFPLPYIELDFKILLLKRISLYSGFKSLLSKFFIKGFNSNTGYVETAYCDQCQPLNFMTSKLVESNIQDFEKWLKSVLYITNVTISFESNLVFNLKCSKPLLSNNLSSIEYLLQMCNGNPLLLSESFTTYIENMNVTMIQSNGVALPQSSWINILVHPYRLVGFPSNDDQASQPSEGYKYLLLFSLENIVLFAPTLVVVKIEGASSPSNKYSLRIQSSDKVMYSEVYYISMVNNMLKRYLGISGLIVLSYQLNSNSNAYEFTLNWFNCSLPADCTHPDVQSVNNKLFSNKNEPNEVFKSQFPSEYKILSLGSTCRNDPPVVQPKLEVNVGVCGFFVYKLSESFATDSTDGSLSNLGVELYDSFRVLVSRSSWVQLDNRTKELLILPNKDVVQSLSIQEKTFFIYVIDSSQQVSISSLYINLQQEGHESYYDIVVEFRSFYPTSASYILLQSTMLNVISTYISDTTQNNQAAEFSKISSTNSYEIFKFKIQNCSVSNYVCPRDNSNLVKNLPLLQTSNGSVNPTFTLFVTQVTKGKLFITSIMFNSIYIINRPPRPVSGLSIALNVSYCNRQKKPFPNALFIDTEDQGSLVYKLFYSNDVEVDSQYWVYFDNQTLFITPFLSTYKGDNLFKIKGIDPCGQAASIDLVIKVLGEPEPSDFSTLFRFVKKTQEQRPYSTEVWNIQENLYRCYGGKFEEIRTEYYEDFGNYIDYRWSNCTIVTKPICNINQIDKANAIAFSFLNNLRPSFVSCFEPAYTIDFAKTIALNDCNVTRTTPPEAKIPPNIYSKFCQELYYEIDENTFIDREDGNTKNLYLELFLNNLDPLPKTEWIAFDSKKQSIRGYPRTGTQVVKNVFYYKLKATDKSGAYAFIDLTITLSGNIPPLDFVYSANIQSNVNYENLVDEELLLITKLKIYFKSKVINDVSYSFYTSVSTNQKTFKWSFCDFPQICSCSIIKSFRDLLVPQKEFADILTPEFTLLSTSDELYGRCLLNNKPVVKLFQNPEMIVVGDFYSYYLPEDTFFDQESGFTRNLSVSLRTKTGVEYLNQYWIHFEPDMLQVCALVSMQLYSQQKSALFQNSLFQYSIVAQDACGELSSMLITTTISYYSYSNLEYIVYSMLVSQSRVYIMSNCSAMSILIWKISNYSGYPKSNIFIDKVEQVSLNTTQISWSYKNLTGGCNDENSRLMSIFTGTTENVDFVNYMAPDYNVSDVSVLSPSCLIVDPKTNNFLWILWLVIAIALLALLVWLLWVCLPICCPAFCATCCGGAFASCCVPTQCCNTQQKQSEPYSTLYADDPYDKDEG